MGRDDKACPACGRFFSAVRCPRCGFSGASSSFVLGCPVCGYSEPPRSDAASEGESPATRERPARPLPLWIWLAALGALVLAVAALAGTLA